MSGVILEIDPQSEDAANVPLVLVDNATYFLLAEDWPAPEVDLSTVSTISTEGELPITTRHHNTTGTFQLRVVGSTAATLQTALNYIDKKLAKIMREGGTLKRTTPSGATYVTDLIAGGAAFQFDRSFVSNNRCIVTVTLPRRPYWRGAAVTLATHTEATLPALIFTEGGAGGSGFSTTALALSPQLYWRHGEPSGTTANDASGNSRTGTYAAGVTLGATGLISNDTDKAISLDATANAKVTSTFNPFTGSITVCGWANATSLAAARNLFGGTVANSPLVQIQTDGSVVWWSDLAAASQTWAAATWTAATPIFWALTWNNATKVSELFINAVSKGTKTSANAFNATPGNFILAGAGTSSSDFLGVMDETLIFSGVMSSANITALYNAGTAAGPIQGDVPGLGRLIVTEAQAADQFWLTYGIRSRYYSSSADAKLFYEAEGRTALGGSATNVGPSGASGTSVMRSAALTTSYVAILGTQATGGGNHLAHAGDFQVYARVQTASANTGAVSLALEWSQGDFLRVTRNSAVTFPVDTWDASWRLVNLGQVSITKAIQGTQRWEGRVLALSTITGDTIDVDYLMLIPVTEGAGIVQGVAQNIAPSSFSARDEFNQGSATFAAAALPIGGAWSTTGSAAGDFTVDTVGHAAKRTAISDGSPRFAIAGTTVLAGVSAHVDIALSGTGSSGASSGSGLLLRYTDTSNYAALYAGYVTNPGITPSQVLFDVVVAGVTTQVSMSPKAWATTSGTWQVIIDTGGRWTVYLSQSGATTLVAQGRNAALATGGTLASGKYGLFDKQASSSAITRTFDNFAAWAYNTDAAVFASRQLEVRNDRVIRQDSAGAVWATPSKFQGDYLLIPASGREGRTAEIVIKACRNDPATMEDSAVDDISAQLVYQPRFLTLPE